MYAAVPTMRPSSVRCDSGASEVMASVSAWTRFAMPKSRTRACPCASTITFSGFTSRCTIPARCAASSADAICTSHCSR
jgi:hypothetical protein